jgi:MFS transporter, DHA2 family, methylenomycin A resistance protein
MLAGLLLGGAGLLSLVVAGAHTSYALLVVPMAAAGFGMALTMPAGAGSQPGWSTRPGSPAGVLGVALLGSLSRARAGLVSGLHIGLMIAAVAFCTGAVVAFWGIERGG